MEDGSLIEPLELRPLVKALAELWGSPEPPEFVRHFSNIVYLLTNTGEKRYLRLTPAVKRSRQMLESEIEFVHHIKSSGIPAAGAEMSLNGNYVEDLRLDHAAYLACVFEEAPGLDFTDSKNLDLAAFYRRAGRLLGEIHLASRRFDPSSRFERFSWHEDRWERFAESVPKSEAAAWSFHDELMEWLKEQPQSADYFGLIHGDYCIGNLRIENNHISVFDFDACCRHWYAYDVAIFLHWFGAGDERARALAYDNLLGAYREVSLLDRTMQNQIPMFGKMRLLFSYLVYAQKWGFEDLEESQERYFELRRRLFEAEPTWPYQ